MPFPLWQRLGSWYVEGTGKLPCVVAPIRRARPRAPSASPHGWADHRKVAQIAFKPDGTRHAKAGPFKRNDDMLETRPIDVMAFPGTGIQENLADTARKLGVPVWKFGGA